tara:strand:- start:71 stop:457 length:387 start_codon:yes stop_codon:yes gene_type:complete
MKDKKLEDFLPSKNTSYFNKLKNKNLHKQISKEEVIDLLKTVKDPEIPVNIYDLGLIYNIEIDKNNNVFIDMTLTNPNCPVAGSMPQMVGKSIENIENLNSINVKLVWQPKWTTELMSEDAKLALDIS